MSSFKRSVMARLPEDVQDRLRAARRRTRVASNGLRSVFERYVVTPWKVAQSRSASGRRLEIGPGASRIEGFETVDIVAGPAVDYVADAARRLPFDDGTFEVVYASHILEHIPWFEVDAAVAEWARVLRSGGTLEIWVPDGLKLARLICDVEVGLDRSEWRDGWRPHNEEDDPYKWINGRLLYGVRGDYPSWHRVVLTPRSLAGVLERAGLVEVAPLARADNRGYDHGWMNLGVRGRKP